jgi:hypothetical protein
MAQGYAGRNRKQPDGKPLFDRLAAGSGGFGTVMEKEIRNDPRLSTSVPVPVFVFWGEKEASDHGKDAAHYLGELGWQVETMMHPGGHVLVESLVREALMRNRSR